MTEENISPFPRISISSAVSIIGSLALVFSLAHEIGFFWTIDKKLMSLMTIQDILSNSLHTVPYTIFTAGIGLLFAMYRIKFIGTDTFHRAIKSNVPIFDMKIGAIAIIFFLFFLPWNVFIFINVILFYGAAISWLQTRPNVPNTQSIADFFFLILLIFQYVLMGGLEARTALRADQFPYKIITNKEEVRQVVLLKTTQNFFIVRNKDSSISAVARTSIMEINKTDIIDPDEPIIPIFRWLRKIFNYLFSFVWGENFSDYGP